MILFEILILERPVYITFSRESIRTPIAEAEAHTSI